MVVTLLVLAVTNKQLSRWPGSRRDIFYNWFAVVDLMIIEEDIILHAYILFDDISQIIQKMFSHTLIWFFIYSLVIYCKTLLHINHSKY